MLFSSTPPTTIFLKCVAESEGLASADKSRSKGMGRTISMPGKGARDATRAVMRNGTKVGVGTAKILS